MTDQSINEGPPAGPLAGIRIIDATSVVSGPAAMGMLADQGADVIKIESPKGDIMRHRGPDPDMTPGFVACNRGKKSVTLDLKKPEAAEILWRLLEDADVFAQNYRPGVIERLGFDAETVLERNPGLVYLSISGVGNEGPYADKRVYDPVVQALSGIAEVQADADTGRPRMIRTIVADKTTAAFAAQAVTAALLSRVRTGKGQHVEVSMLDTIVSYIWPEGMAPFTKVGGEDLAHKSSAHDMIFPTSDGYITLGAVSDPEWKALCEAVDRPELIDDPRFVTAGLRNTNRQERLETIEAALGDYGREEILGRLQAADVPCAPVLSRWEMLDNEQVKANDLIHELDQPGMGRVRQARPAAMFSGTPQPQLRPARMLGEDTDSVLSELGFSDDEIAAFRDNGAIS